MDAPFDVEQFRVLSHRRAVVRLVDRPTVVLGSAQRSEVISAEQAVQSGVEIVRRRGGGGAVLLQPGDHLWLDAWVPRDDPLWVADVVAAARWAGAWWRDALAKLGAGESLVHEGRSEPGPHGALVCFSGRGPGEVFQDGRKVMGLSQWRSREGALFHTCAYAHWDPRPLADLLVLDPSARKALVGDLARSAVGLDDLDSAGVSITRLGEALMTSFSTWGGDRSTTREGRPSTPA